MAEDTSVAEPIVGLETVNPVVPETQPETQVQAEPQSTVATQVESDVNKPQVQEPPRPQYDGLFRQERKRIRRLEEEIKRLSQPQPKTEAPKSEPLDHNLLYQDPDKYLSAREQKLRDEISALRNEVVQERQGKQAVEKEHKQLEALEKLFPKTSPDSKETLEERINRNPEMTEKIKEFFEDEAVKAMAEKDPEKAVRFAIQELGITPPKPNPMVLKKTAMGGINTGNPGMGSKTSVSVADLQAELRNMNLQLGRDANLRFDPKWKARKEELMLSVERQLKEKRG